MKNKNTKEIWLPIKGLKNCLISNHGRAISHTGKILKPQKLPSGLRYYPFKKKNCLIHRLVGTHFIPNPHKFKNVKHKDGNLENNHVSNLFWTTVLAKPVHLKHIDGRQVKYSCISDFARKYKIPKTHISQILNRNKRRSVFYQGWYDASPLKNPIYLKNDANKTVKITNLGDFIVKHGMSHCSLTMLLNGKWPWYKGYRLADSAMPQFKDKTVYTRIFQNKQGRKVVTESRSRKSGIPEFARKNNLFSSAIYSLGTGKRWHYKGWRLKEVTSETKSYKDILLEKQNQFKPEYLTKHSK